MKTAWHQVMSSTIRDGRCGIFSALAIVAYSFVFSWPLVLASTLVVVMTRTLCWNIIWFEPLPHIELNSVNIDLDKIPILVCNRSNSCIADDTHLAPASRTIPCPSDILRQCDDLSKHNRIVAYNLLVPPGYLCTSSAFWQVGKFIADPSNGR
jgi:hypothetical protein